MAYVPDYPRLALDQKTAALQLLQNPDLPSMYAERLRALASVDPNTILTQRQWIDRIDDMTLWPRDLDSIIA